MLSELYAKHSVRNSINLFINLIVTWHFPDAPCIMQLSHSVNNYYLPASINFTVPQMINSPKCYASCFHYIVFDPISTNRSEFLRNCIPQNTEHRFKAIVFLENDDIYDKAYTFFSMESIFVRLENDYLVIQEFSDWNQTTVEIVNRWSLIENRFLDVSVDIESFFRRKRYSNATIFGFVPTDTIPPAFVYRKNNL